MFLMLTVEEKIRVEAMELICELEKKNGGQKPLQIADENNHKCHLLFGIW